MKYTYNIRSVQHCANLLVLTSTHYIHIYRIKQSSYSFDPKSDSVFANNFSPQGAVIYAERNTTIDQYGSVLITNNLDKYTVVYQINSKFNVHNSGNVTFHKNIGSLVAFNSNITFIGSVCLKIH